MSLLIAYATKHEATAGIAERIAATLHQMGQSVHVQPIESVGDLTRYEAFVIGSAVYYGSWMKEAVEFVRDNRETLATHPTWLFSSGPTGDAALADPKEMAELKEAIGPREHRVFAGKLDRHTLSIAERMVVSVVKAPKGDFRDWEAIDAWAEGIARTLTPTPATVGEVRPRPQEAG